MRCFWHRGCEDVEMKEIVVSLLALLDWILTSNKKKTKATNTKSATISLFHM